MTCMKPWKNVKEWITENGYELRIPKRDSVRHVISRAPRPTDTAYELTGDILEVWDAEFKQTFGYIFIYETPSGNRLYDYRTK